MSENENTEKNKQQNFFKNFLHNYPIISIIIILVAVTFLWDTIDHEGFVTKINQWLRDVWEIAKFFIALAIIAFALKIMFRKH